jgi:hypothetical protein
MVRFEAVDGSPGEAELGGLIKPGFRLTAINDSNITYSSFPNIINALVASPRPIRLTWRDPSVPEFRDRYGFLKSKLHVEQESAQARLTEEARKRNDHEWVDLLAELGGKRGASFGVSRLARDARGAMLFPLEPSIRLNAVSPIHARMTGISSNADFAAARALHHRGSSVPQPPAPADSVSSGDPVVDPHLGVVVSIFKRCWAPGGIGIAVPPGLDVALPGEIPPQKTLDKYNQTLQRLVLHGGVPAAFRAAIWYEMSGAHAKAALHPPSYYARLCEHKPRPESSYAISKDLDRTFPGHPAFDSRAGLESLRRLLGAFSVHNGDIGYCEFSFPPRV